MDQHKLQQRVLAAQVDQVYQTAVMVHGVSIIVVLIMTLSLWNSVPGPVLLGWFVVMVVVSAMRTYLALYYRRAYSSRPLEDWARWFRIGTLVTGVILGSSAGFMFMVHELTQHFVLLLISVGMVAGAVTSLSPYMPAFKRLFFAITLPYLLALFLEGSIATEHASLMLNMAFLYVVFTIALYSFAVTANRRVIKGLYHQFENEVLAENLKAAAVLREAMQDELILAERIIANVKEGIIVTDHNNRIVRINDTFSYITGYTEAEVLGKSPSILSSGKQDRTYYTNMWQAIAHFGQWDGEIWNRRKNGEIYPEWLSISGIKDSKGKISHYVGWFRDITERKREEERLSYLANYDVMTGLPNRKMFIERLDNELADCQERQAVIALLFIDLNLFKSVNDNFGHDVGDVLLKQVAMRLKSQIRSEDMVARLGGDEFVILLRDLNDGKDAIRVADKLIEIIEAPFYINQHECRVGFAIGISLAPEHGVERRVLLHKADRAMYQAKRDRSLSSWSISEDTGAAS